MSTVIVENVGPVERLAIPIPENGGLVVLRGRNGAGKTRTLEGIESLATGNGRVSVRDGALNGRIEGFGARMTIARSTRRSGELEVVTLDGKLNAADLVDPGIKSPESADAHRIRALIQTAGIDADASLFYPLFGGREQFERIASNAIKNDADPVELATRIKREAESAARVEEAQAETALSHARAHREAAGDVSDVQVPPALTLQSNLEEAVRRRSDLASSVLRASEALRNAEQARRSLAGIEPVDIDAAELSAKMAFNALSAVVAEVEEAEKRLRDCCSARDLAAEKLNSAHRALEYARKLSEQRAELEKLIAESYRVVMPNEQQLEEAELRVSAAQKAVEEGVRVRDALQRLEHAKRHQEEAEQHTSRAAALRQAARGTDEVLSGLVGTLGTPLRVEAGRLVLTTDRGDTYFGDLSHGERWKLAIDLCVDQVGAAGLLVIPQEAFEGLDGHNRREIAEHAQRRGVLVITAEASEDDEITAEVFGR